MKRYKIECRLDVFEVTYQKTNEFGFANLLIYDD